MSIIGIIGAMEEEVMALKEKMNIKEVKNLASLEFYIGTIDEKSVVVVRCGIGKVNAAVCTQVLIDHFHVDYVINTGVAGAIYEGLDIGDIVISSDTAYHDFDTTVFGHKLGEIPRMDQSFFQADRNLIELARKASESLETVKNVFISRIVSGDQFVSDRNRKAVLWESFEGYCTEMEGAAIAHVCYLNHIPFVIIRSISDKADDSADMNFNEFVELAAQNSSEIIEEMINHIV